MEKELLIAVQNALDCVGGLNYVGENWGQLEYYDSRPPVNFPCGLYDITAAGYVDRSRGSQQAVMEVTINIADYRGLNVSSQSPETMRAFEIFDLLNEVYRALQGLECETFTPLTRKRLERVRRDDGVREYQMVFQTGWTDNSALKQTHSIHPYINPKKKPT